MILYFFQKQYKDYEGVRNDLESLRAERGSSTSSGAKGDELPIVTLTKATFVEKVLEKTDSDQLVLFYGNNCNTCAMMKIVLSVCDQALRESGKEGQIQLLLMDSEEAGQWVPEKDLMYVPHFLLYKAGDKSNPVEVAEIGHMGNPIRVFDWLTENATAGADMDADALATLGSRFYPEAKRRIRARVKIMAEEETKVNVSSMLMYNSPCGGAINQWFEDMQLRKYLGVDPNTLYTPDECHVLKEPEITKYWEDVGKASETYMPYNEPDESKRGIMKLKYAAHVLEGLEAKIAKKKAEDAKKRT